MLAPWGNTWLAAMMLAVGLRIRTGGLRGDFSKIVGATWLAYGLSLLALAAFGLDSVFAWLYSMRLRLGMSK